MRERKKSASDEPVLTPAGDHAVVKDPALLVQQDAQSRSERPVSFGAGHRQIRERSRQQVREEGERSRAGESVRTATCQRVLDLGLRWAWEGKLTSTGPCVLRRRGRKISGLGGVPQLRRMRTAFVSSVHRPPYSVYAPLTWAAGDLGLVSAFVPERHFPPGEFDHVASVRAVECIQGGLLDLFSWLSISQTSLGQRELADTMRGSVNPSGAHRSGKGRGTATARGVGQHASGLQSVPREHLVCSERLTRTVRGRRASARPRDSKRQPLLLEDDASLMAAGRRPSQISWHSYDRASTRSIVRKTDRG